MSLASFDSSQRRQRHWTDNQIQTGLLKRIVAHWVILLVVSSCALMIWIRLFEQPDATWSVIFEEYLWRYIPLALVFLALLPAFVMDTLRLSNRFAGPMYRMGQTLSQAAQGQTVNPLEFRKNDFLRKMAEDLNSILQAPAAPTATTEAGQQEKIASSPTESQS